MTVHCIANAFNRFYPVQHSSQAHAQKCRQLRARDVFRLRLCHCCVVSLQATQVQQTCSLQLQPQADLAGLFESQKDYIDPFTLYGTNL
jgi:hypothetical protein